MDIIHQNGSISKYIDKEFIFSSKGFSVSSMQFKNKPVNFCHPKNVTFKYVL